MSLAPQRKDGERSLRGPRISVFIEPHVKQENPVKVSHVCTLHMYTVNRVKVSHVCTLHTTLCASRNTSYMYIHVVVIGNTFLICAYFNYAHTYCVQLSMDIHN